ncbi:MAG: SPOR domain-containing protein, partial [Gammaproteobacteria bacterium]|nr:SPOR domain-containing protein [Gammaproteobacteria bacterium]
HLHHSRAADMQRVIADSIAPDPSPADTTRKPKFEFYETLPNAMKNVMADGTTHAAPRVAPRQGTQYFIQAGAFRRANEADRLRAELALLGLEAQVKRSRDWHKVRLGPFRDLSALSAVKKRLPAASKPMVYEIKI